MHYKAILFDMDGTLLPMDQDAFLHGYFKLLYKKLARFGLDSHAFGQNMLAGVAAMAKNDGTQTNEARFWDIFCHLTGQSREVLNAECLPFYQNEFHQAKQFTSENPLAKEAVQTARQKAEYVILATNPMFPMVGQETRMGWVCLKPEDFDLVTAYEDECFCKPNPMYFTSICQRLNLRPEECLMIGNDEKEDMYAATQAGLHCWLITDCRIPCAAHPWNGPMGTFAETLEMLKQLD